MQNRHHVLLRYKLWLTQITGKDILGEEKFGLLRNIKRLGSLSAAARAMGISYRKAWGDIREAEALIGYSLTIKERGGSKGGRSILTPNAEKLLEAYEALHRQLDENVEAAYQEFLKKLPEKP